MGACDFHVRSSGHKTAEEAFRSLVDQALWDHGHAGYSGTIAEKSEFIMIDVPSGKDPVAYVDELMDKMDERVIDKWGPAGCVKVKDGEWIFFGWASS